MTTTGNGNTQRKPSGPTARSVDRKVTDLAKDHDATKGRVLSLEGRYDSDIASVTQRLGTQGKSVKLIGRHMDSLQYTVSQLGQRLGEDHDTIVANLTPRLQKLEARVADGMSLELASKVAGFTPDEVKEILRLQAEDNLDDTMFVTAMVDTIRWIKVRVAILTEDSAVHRQELDQHNVRLNGHEVRLDRNTTSIMEIAERQVRHEEKVKETIRLTTKTPIWALPVAVVSFLFVWLVVWLTGSQLAGNVIQNGKNVGTFHANIHFGWVGFFLGLVAAGLVLVATRGAKVSLKRKAKKETGNTADLKKTPTLPVSVRKDEPQPAHS